MAAPIPRYLARLRREVRRGFLPFWVMEELATGPEYGYALMERLRKQTGSPQAVSPSTLYPTLARLRSAGLVRVFHGTTSNGPVRKYYELTPGGRAALPAIRELWGEVVRVPTPAVQVVRVLPEGVP
jgi:PadR family transcriptional regulator, regulatory protein PadR